MTTGTKVPTDTAKIQVADHTVTAVRVGYEPDTPTQWGRFDHGGWQIQLQHPEYGPIVIARESLGLLEEYFQHWVAKLNGEPNLLRGL